MADEKISAMPAAAAFGGAELVPMVQAGGNVAATPAQQFAFDFATWLTNAAAAFAAGDLIAMSQGGVPVKGTPAQMAAYVASLGYALHPGFVSGDWYGPQKAAALNTSTAAIANNLIAIPIVVPLSVTIQGLGIRVVTGVAATAVILAIYDSLNGRPNNLLGNTSLAGIPTTTTAVDASGALAGGNLVLKPGVYWLASLFNGAPVPANLTGNDPYLQYFVGGANVNSTVSSTNTNANGLAGTATFAGGPPTPFGAAAIRTSGSVPAVAMQVA